MIAIFGLVLAEIAMVYFSITISENNRKRYMELATDLSNTVALSINKDEISQLKNDIITIYDSYTDKPERAKGETPQYKEYMAKVAEVKKTSYYLSLQSYLHSIKLANKDTDGVYAAFVDYTNKLCVYLVYDQENDVYPVGVIDALYEEDYPMIDNPKLGFVASIYESELDGGYLCTAGAPILDKDGNVIAYALVDFSLNTMRGKQADSIVRLFLYLLLSVVGISIIGVIIVNFTLIKPVKTMQNAAKSYDVNKPEETHEQFKQLRVKTHDEFADLAENMRNMENDIHNKIKELTTMNEELTNSQRFASEMVVLANKDALTGIRNKTAYDKMVEQIDNKIKDGYTDFAIGMVDLNYLKNINDEYGHACGDVALVKLCNLICATFVHSPVYRIGGDEFVVLLRNTDLRNVDKLINEFNNKIESMHHDNELEPYERTSAAIGYARFDKQTDTCVEDVFKKADQNMYARKREMKKQDK